MGELLDAVPDGGSGHTEHHRDLATAIEAADVAALSTKVGSGVSAPAEDGFLIGTGGGASEWKSKEQAATIMSTPFVAVLENDLGGVLRRARVTVTSAELLDLNTTPVQLVAAPGAGSFLGIHKVIVNLTGSTTPYALVDSVGIRFVGYTPFVSLSGLLSGDIGDRTYQYSTVEPSEATSAFDNNAVELYAFDGNPTLGDGGLVITVWYSVEDVP